MAEDNAVELTIEYLKVREYVSCYQSDCIDTASLNELQTEHQKPRDRPGNDGPSMCGNVRMVFSRPLDHRPLLDTPSYKRLVHLSILM